ncbi:MAG: polyprenyl synthetase family protein [Clostridia bacterium]|nr:polyprenyl synthetase family protein [Clostridia bacterium]
MRDRLLRSLAENSADIEKAVNEYYSSFSDPDTAEVREAEIYSLLAGGKRIRAYLVNEACRAFGGNKSASMPFALAIEMMHTFSLIHDDLPCMDDDDLRRGRPTSHKVFGEATALLAGDSLAIRSIEVALANPCVCASDARRAALALSRAAGSEGMIGGQMIDLRGEKQALDRATLEKLHNKKTGELIAVSVYLGCVAAGLADGDERTSTANEFARAIGLAFQIIDDVLDVTSDSTTLGKTVGKDSEHNKTTFMSFMMPDEALKFADAITESAIKRISAYQNTEMLVELAKYLLQRKN